MKAKYAVAFLLLMSLAPCVLGKDKKWDIPCQKVFVAGTQAHEIAWALEGEGLNNNLYKKTCLQPVSDASKADAILDIEIDPKVVPLPNRRLESDSYWVNCSSDRKGSYCVDSEGYSLETSCNVRGCSSYYGPDLASAVVDGLHSLTDAYLKKVLESAAWGYLFSAKDHHLIWKYEGNGQWHADITKYSECQKKGKWGTAPANMCKAPTKLLD